MARLWRLPEARGAGPRLRTPLPTLAAAVAPQAGAALSADPPRRTGGSPFLHTALFLEQRTLRCFRRALRCGLTRRTARAGRASMRQCVESGAAK
jgi:hypothetical protein